MHFGVEAREGLQCIFPEKGRKKCRGEQLEELRLRDMDKHKINRNFRFFFCGYRFFFLVLLIWGA